MSAPDLLAPLDGLIEEWRFRAGDRRFSLHELGASDSERICADELAAALARVRQQLEADKVDGCKSHSSTDGTEPRKAGTED
jgi:hypothetical protein